MYFMLLDLCRVIIGISEFEYRFQDSFPNFFSMVSDINTSDLTSIRDIIMSSRNETLKDKISDGDITLQEIYDTTSLLRSISH